MSGEMSTSLGNGFTNVNVARFIASQAGGDLTIVVEGDDAVFACTKPIDESKFSSLGFKIKIIKVDSIYETSFCGLMMAKDLTAIKDPRKVILNFGWSHSMLMNGGTRVRKELLRAKGMSLLCELPSCPILGLLALRVLQMTEGHRERFTDAWAEANVRLMIELDRVGECYIAATKGPSIVARSDFELIFDVPLSLQMEIEEHFRKCVTPESLFDHPGIESLFHSSEFDDCRHYFANYVRPPGLDY